MPIEDRLHGELHALSLGRVGSDCRLLQATATYRLALLGVFVPGVVRGPPSLGVGFGKYAVNGESPDFFDCASLQQVSSPMAASIVAGQAATGPARRLVCGAGRAVR